MAKNVSGCKRLQHWKYVAHGKESGVRGSKYSSINPLYCLSQLLLQRQSCTHLGNLGHALTVRFVR